MKLKFYSLVIFFILNIGLSLLVLTQVKASEAEPISINLELLMQSIEENNLTKFNQQIIQVKQLNENYMGQTALYKAAKLGRLDMVSLLLKHGAEIDKAADSTITPLMAAAYYGQSLVVEELINQDANLILEHSGGYKAFDWALENNQINILKVILKGLIKMTSRTDKAWIDYALGEQKDKPASILPDKNIQSFALIAAVLNDDQISLSQLIQLGFNPDFHNTTGYAALPLAARLDRMAMVELLLKSGANINLGNNGNDEASAINQAARAGNFPMLKRIIEAGADVNKQNAKGFAALHLASNKGALDCVIYLLAHKAQINLKTEDGFTAFDYAYQSANKAIITELLLDGLGEPVKKIAKIALTGGEFPKNAVITKHSGFISAAIVAGLNFNLLKAQLLINNNINQPVLGYYPLNLAARFDQFELVKSLVENGSQIDQLAQTGYQTSPLMDAARENGNLEIAKYLLQHKAQIKLSDKNGDPAINWATYYGHYDLVKMLLQNGADPLQSNKDQYTALRTAKEQGHRNIVELIEAHLKP